MDANAVRETIQTLGALEPLGSDLRVKVAAIIESCGKSLSLGGDDVLIHEGDVAGGSGFVLLSGTMRVEQEGQPSVSIGAPALLGEMHQFNPKAQRTATVSASSPCEVLKFSWFDFQMRAMQELNAAEQDALMEAMAQLVWKRFHHEAMFNVPAFGQLEETARLRLCLTLVWIAHQEEVASGDTLFTEGQPQNGMGYLLLEGEIALLRGGQPFWQCTAPDLIGAATQLDPARRWSATARALSDASLMRFEWSELEGYLIQRLGEGETQRALAVIEASCAEGFTY